MANKTQVARRGGERSARSLKDIFPEWFGYFFGGRAKLTDPNEVDASSAGEIASGLSVTINSTLQLSAAWACIRLLSETIATLPCNVFERGTGSDRKVAPTHPLYELLHNSPNADMTAVSFWQAYIASMLTCGYGAAEKILEGERIVAIDFLFGPGVSVRKTKKGARIYEYTDASGKQREVPEERMWITPAFSLDGRLGLSPIRYGAGVLGTAMAADQSAGRWFGNGMRPLGVLKTDKIFTPEQREQIRTSITEKFAGVVNTGKTMVLEAGMSYEHLSLNPEDAQLLQTRSFGVEEICRWFGVPPIMVGHSEKVTAWGTGIEQIIIGFLTFSLRPWLTRIEQSVRRSLLLPGERPKYFAEFSVEGLLRADSAARSAFYSTMTQNGIMKRNECRKLENLPPVDGGDVITVQSNLISITKLGSEPTGAEKLRTLLADIVAGREQ